MKLHKLPLCTGSRVRLIDTKGIPSSWRKKIKKNGIYTVRRIKSSGGVLLDGIVLGFQHELAGGNEQGLVQSRFRVLPAKKKK